MAARRKPKPKAANSPKRGRGRPSDYRPELCAMVEKLARLGLTDAEMADTIGKPIQTFDRWKAQHEEFREALKRGKAEADANVADRLYQRAMGYTHVSEKVFCQKGEVVRAETTEHHYPPDTAAAIFWLCNRQRHLWRQRVDHEHGGHVKITHEQALAEIE